MRVMRKSSGNRRSQSQGYQIEQCGGYEIVRGSGIEIDYCPECRGIWLDRGELEKLLAAEEKVVNGKEEKEIETKQTPRKKESFKNQYN